MWEFVGGWSTSSEIHHAMVDIVRKYGSAGNLASDSLQILLTVI
jgi:hypothetical protein